MIGGFSTPKKDHAIKISAGQPVKTGQILVRGLSQYKAGKNVKGAGTLFALCSGKIFFTRKKTPHGKFRTFINILPAEKPAK
ncbi:MAG: 50S ribosomal protein L27 [Candidatus Omnitrophica bacterium]|jgi:ribosomal protein L27|nr:50S ribosomal protein L27 [Candidatus Omnitrophota bacterium]MDD5513656.1 50S ribosomal protein L27 [Candidatus Omnitrophota bacterium]